VRWALQRIEVSEGFYGRDITMFPGDSNRHDLKDWLYRIALPSGAKPGTWYFWCRVSFPGAPGDLESHFLWVLSDPGDGKSVPKTRTAGEIEDADDRLFGDVPGMPMTLEWKCI